jgi:hypothetical protein
MNHPGIWIMGDLAMRLRRSGSPLTSLGQCAAVLNSDGCSRILRLGPEGFSGSRVCAVTSRFRSSSGVTPPLDQSLQLCAYLVPEP